MQKQNRSVTALAGILTTNDLTTLLREQKVLVPTFDGKNDYFHKCFLAAMNEGNKLKIPLSEFKSQVPQELADLIPVYQIWKKIRNSNSSIAQRLASYLPDNWPGASYRKFVLAVIDTLSGS